MNIKHLSPTKLEAIRTCEARVMDQLDEDTDSEESGELAKVGTLAHAAAKFWYSPEYRDKIQTMDDAFKSGIKEVTDDLDLCSNEGIQTARGMFETIAAQYDRSKLNVVFAERSYKGYLANGVPVSLKIDLAVDMGGGVLGIIDFKTGFLSIPDDDMWNKDQVLLNLLVVSHYDDTLRHFTSVQFQYFWVRQNYESRPVHLTEERLRDYEYAISLEYERILKVTEPQERVNPFCGSCLRRTRCQKYREAMSEAMGCEEPLSEKQMDMLSDEDLMARVAELQTVSKSVDGHASLLKNVLKARLEKKKASGGEPKINGERLKAWLQQSTTTDYDNDTVMRLAELHKVPIPNIAKFMLKRVEEAFASHQGATDELKRTSRRIKGAPFVRVGAVPAKRGKK